MKPIGTLNLNFGGLIQIPMAISTFANYQDISFKQVCPQGHYIAYKKVCPECNQEIAKEDLQKAYKIDKEHKIVFDKKIIEEIKARHKESSILKVFSDGELDNSVRVMIEKVYYLTPKAKFEKPYYIMRNSLMSNHNSILIDFVLRSRKQIGLVEPFGRYLVLLQLLYPEQIRKPEPLEEIEVSEKDMGNAKALLQSLKEETKNVFLKDVKDEYKKELFEAIMSGKPIIPTTVSNDFSNQLEKIAKKLKPQELVAEVKRKANKK